MTERETGERGELAPKGSEKTGRRVRRVALVSALVGVLGLVVFACARRTGERSVGRPARGATAAPAVDAATTRAAATATDAGRDSRAPYAGDVVERAYAALARGDLDAARAAFASLGPVRPWSAQQAVNVAALDGGGALVRIPSLCDFGGVGHDACSRVLDRVGGSCTADGHLQALCGAVFVDAAQKRVAFFPRGDAQAVGTSLVVSPTGASSSVRGEDGARVVTEVPGDVVASLDDGELVAVRTLEQRAEQAKIEVRLVSPKDGRVGPPCAITIMGGRPSLFRLVGSPPRLLVRSGIPYGTLAVCAPESGKLLGSWNAEGENVGLLDTEQKTLFVSGVPVRSARAALASSSMGAPPPPFVTMDHFAVDLATGHAERVRSREGSADIPGRDLAWSAPTSTLVVSTDGQVAFFGVRPFRRLGAVHIDVGVPLDSSYNTSLRLTPLPDGVTFLGRYAVTDVLAAGPNQRQLTWLLSAKTHGVVLRGANPGPIHAADGNIGFLLDTVDAKGDPERSVVTSTAGGGFRRRPLGAVATGAIDPPELAGLPIVDELPGSSGSSSHLFPEPEPAPAPEPLVDALATSLCSAGGLPVPRALFPDCASR